MKTIVCLQQVNLPTSLLHSCNEAGRAETWGSEL